MKHLPPARPKMVPKLKMLKISILMSEIVFIKYLPSVRPNLVSKLKVFRIYSNLAHSIFQDANLEFDV